MINNIPLIISLILFSLSAKPEINITDPDNNKIYSAKAVIIIDDMGNQYKPCLPLIKSEYPITLSILPFCPFSKKIAAEGYATGHEIILHTPMESWDNALLLSCDADFVPTVTSLRRRGKLVVGAGFSNASPALMRE